MSTAVASASIVEEDTSVASEASDASVARRGFVARYDNTRSASLQIALAASLGYPDGWRVVRTVEEGSPLRYFDRIHAGDPAKHADAYFNHHAASVAALRFEGDPRGDKGGQLLLVRARFSAGDAVEVRRDDDGAVWDDAVIVRARSHVDGARYTVRHVRGDVTRTNVREHLVRTRSAKKTKKKKKSSSSSSSSNKAKRKETSESSAPEKAKTQKTMASFLSTPVAAAVSSDDPERADALELARRVGLPAGWTAVTKSNYGYDVRSPCGRHRFRSRKAAFAFLAANPSSTVTNNDDNDNAADPPWRTTEHEWLGRSVRWERSGTTQTGTVTGWLSETDVDSAGAPAFRSESDGRPARLFHVTFPPRKDGRPGDFLFVDLEEYELRDVLLRNDDGD